MKRVLTFAMLTLIALSSPSFAGDKDQPKGNAGPVIRDYRTKGATAGSGPVIRDHRTKAVLPANNGPIIRDHRTNVGSAVKTGPVIRDHRTTTPELDKSKEPIRTTVMPGVGKTGPINSNQRPSVAKPLTGYKVPPVYHGNGTVVRDHRNGAGAAGGIKVTTSPRPRQPVDNTVRGVGPGPLDVIDAIDNGLSDISRGVGTVGSKVGNAAEKVGTKVGNAVGAVGDAVGNVAGAVGDLFGF